MDKQEEIIMHICGDEDHRRKGYPDRPEKLTPRSPLTEEQIRLLTPRLDPQRLARRSQMMGGCGCPEN